MENGEIDVRGILGVLRRQFRLIAATFVLVVAVGTVIAYSMTPIYSSAALVLVDTSKKNLLEPEAQFNAASVENARIESEVEIMRADNILLQVIASENLIEDPEFGVSIGTRDRLLSLLRVSQPEPPTGEEAVQQSLSRLKRAVTIQRRGLTYLISVGVQSANPASTARIANAIANAYIADQLNSKVNAIVASRNILQSQLAGARDAIVTSETAFDTFLGDNLERIVSETGRTDFALMQNQIQSLVQSRDASVGIAQQIQTQLQSNDMDALVASLASQATDELARQRLALNETLADTPPDSSEAINLRAELAQLDESLRNEARQRISSLQQQVTDAQTNEDDLRQRLRQQVLTSGLSTDVLTDLYDLQQTAELARTQYQTLLSRIQDLEAQSNLQIADSRLVSEALEPNSPSAPNKNLIIAASALVALLLGVFLAFLYENLIGGFASEEQMAAGLKVPVAAAIPIAKDNAEGDSIADQVITAPLSQFSESVRRIRATIDQRQRAKQAGAPSRQGMVLMVSSTAPREGKTTTALSLARSYAVSGRRTVLIDADLRKPSLHNHLKMATSQGLRDFLQATDDSLQFGEIVARDPLSNVCVVLAARNSDVPTDQLLSGLAFSRLIDAARKVFDVVVLDTAPIAPVVDGLYIASYVDYIVFLTRWATTSQTDVRRSIASLREAKRPDTEIFAVLSQQSMPKTQQNQKYGGYYRESA